MDGPIQLAWYFINDPAGPKPITPKSSFEADYKFLNNGLKNLPPREEWVKLLTHFWNEAFPKTSKGDIALDMFALLCLSPLCYPLGRDAKKRSIPKSDSSYAGGMREEFTFSVHNLDTLGFDFGAEEPLGGKRVAYAQIIILLIPRFPSLIYVGLTNVFDESFGGNDSERESDEEFAAGKSFHGGGNGMCIDP